MEGLSQSAVQVKRKIDSSHDSFDNELMDTQNHNKTPSQRDSLSVFQLLREDSARMVQVEKEIYDDFDNGKLHSSVSAVLHVQLTAIIFL